MKLYILLFATIYLFLGIDNSGIAQSKAINKQDKDSSLIEVEIRGLACPFCAYSLEKKMKKLDGANNLVIDIDKGLATLYISKGKTLSEDEIRAVIINAGFTPGYVRKRKN